MGAPLESGVALPQALANYGNARVRVVMAHYNPLTKVWSYHRFGFSFGKEAVEIPLSQLGEELDGQIEKIIGLVSEENLRVALIFEDGAEVDLEAGDLPALNALFEKARAAFNRCPHCGRSIAPQPINS